MVQCHPCMTSARSQRCSRFRACGTHMTGSTSRDSLVTNPRSRCLANILLYGWTGRQSRTANGSAGSTIARARNLGAAELLVGDVLLLVVFCLYKQIMAITMAPTFPGWLAPLQFSPVRFEELLGFMVTVAGTWVACSTILGDYRNPSESPLLFHGYLLQLVTLCAGVHEY